MRILTGCASDNREIPRTEINDLIQFMRSEQPKKPLLPINTPAPGLESEFLASLGKDSDEGAIIESRISGKLESAPISEMAAPPVIREAGSKKGGFD